MVVACLALFKHNPGHIHLPHIAHHSHLQLNLLLKIPAAMGKGIMAVGGRMTTMTTRLGPHRFTTITGRRLLVHAGLARVVRAKHVVRPRGGGPHVVGGEEAHRMA
jgi:hypothetical protein